MLNAHVGRVGDVELQRVCTVLYILYYGVPMLHVLHYADNLHYASDTPTCISGYCTEGDLECPCCTYCIHVQCMYVLCMYVCTVCTVCTFKNRAGDIY